MTQYVYIRKELVYHDDEFVKQRTQVRLEESVVFDIDVTSATWKDSMRRTYSALVVRRQ